MPPKIGLFSIGLAAYWPQFPGLRERLEGYGEFVALKLSEMGGAVVNAGMVDDQPKAVATADLFAREDVDLVVCYVTTYSTSSQVVPAVQRLGKPVLVLNLQPTSQLKYLETGTGEWLANCQACCVPEIACAFERCSIEFNVVTGLLGLEKQTPGALANEVTASHPEAVRAWEEIRDWVDAVRVVKGLRRSRFGFLGHTYPGMLDMYSDFTQITGQFGCHIEVLEMEDLEACVSDASPELISQVRGELESVFEIPDGSDSADPLAQRPSDEALEWSCRVAAGLELLRQRHDLQGLAYYHRGLGGNQFEQIVAGMIVGCSLLTAKGVPCSGEGDLKNLISMKIMDLLGAGGSFTEFYAMDFEEDFILMGHDGPFHLAIAEGKPVLRGLGLYHGKSGSGVSVEAKVKLGPVTILGLTQTRDGRMKLMPDQGQSLPGDTLRIGNTNSRLRFPWHSISQWMGAWTAQGPTHHVALGVGHMERKIKLVGRILGMEVT